MLGGAADLLSRRGVGGVSIRSLADHSGTPLGSTYHFFPGGKQQLVAEAVRHAGDRVDRMLHAALEAGPVVGLERFIGAWRAILVDSGFETGCPVLSVAVTESRQGDGARGVELADAAFTTWQSTLAASLHTSGCGKERARQLALLVVTAVEGAIVLCRAAGSIAPLDEIERVLLPLVRASTVHVEDITND